MQTEAQKKAKLKWRLKNGKDYYSKNRERILLKRRETYQRPENKAKNSLMCSLYRQKNKEKILAKNKLDYYRDKEKRAEYKRLNRDKIRERENMVYKTNLNYKMGKILRSSLLQSIKLYSSTKKNNKTMSYVGLTKEQFKNYIKQQFQPGMNWGNWGHNGWHIDHIRPVSSFDLNNPEELNACMHYTNLRPLWAKENIIKRNKYPKADK